MYTLNCKGRLLVIDKPLLMGIINATPDSFFNGSRSQGVDAILIAAEQMLNEGADILDIGGQSTRPGSEMITVDEELTRVIPGLEAIHKRFPDAFISIDTFYAKVAEQAVAHGASIVNDISAGALDPALISVVAALKVPYVLTHMKGSPKTMGVDPVYADVTKDVIDFFLKKIHDLRAAGIIDIIIDPGFGFGKTIAHNFQLLNQLDTFQIFGKPVLAGLSRKSTIYKTLGISAEESLNGSTVMHTIALMHGASILRVHDVKEASETIKLVEACRRSTEK